MNWKACQALALGYGSFYNHYNLGNVRYEADAENRLLHFMAVRDIANGEEFRSLRDFCVTLLHTVARCRAKWAMSGLSVG